MTNNPKKLVAVLTIVICFAITAVSANAGALGKSVSKQLAHRFTARESVRAVERQAMARQLKELDDQTLRVIEKRFGKYLPRDTLTKAHKMPTTYLDGPAYQKHLQRHYPRLSRSQIRNIVGDTHSVTGKITVKSNQVTLARVVAHERSHQLSHPHFRLRFGRDFNEGATDYFAARVSKDLHLKGVMVGYPTERDLASMVAARVGEGPLARAYFRGEVKALAKHLDRELGAGSFAVFEKHIQQREFAAARALLRGNRP